MTLEPSGLPLLDRAPSFGPAPALVGPGEDWSYATLLGCGRGTAQRLLRALRADAGHRAGRPHPEAGVDLHGARICYLVPAGAHHVAVQWGIWACGGVAVPLAVSHPAPELARVMDDARPLAVVADPHSLAKVAPLALSRGIPALSTEELVRPPEGDGPALPTVDPDRAALILYTSGTTGRAKGVVSTHANITAQIRALVEAWEWDTSDRILHVLPLHHVHGIVNALSCALWSGATCEFLPFEPDRVWQRLASGEPTLFMAVPTIYHRLIRAWRAAPTETRREWSAGAAGLRLMVSGSAALPVGVLEEWRDITGHTLLERYGMTEIGMGLSNPLRGERRPGTVGRPLPGVEARIVDPEGQALPEGVSGQIEIRGPQVFTEYWDRTDATRHAFVNGWFQTGDEGVVEDGYWSILGRQSVDIIKSGGYKISALEIENSLLEHPRVDECAVVGVPDEEWGDRVCAAIVTDDSSVLTLEDVRIWAKERLAPYKAPRSLRCVASLPRNAMGKVNKNEVAKLFAPDRTDLNPQ